MHLLSFKNAFRVRHPSKLHRQLIRQHHLHAICKVSRATLSHEMDVGHQKLRKNCNFEVLRATLSHEMDVGRPKLRKHSNLQVSRATLSHEMEIRRQKLRKNCDFELSIATLTHEISSLNLKIFNLNKGSGANAMWKKCSVRTTKVVSKLSELGTNMDISKSTIPITHNEATTRLKPQKRPAVQTKWCEALVCISQTVGNTSKHMANDP